MTNIVTEGKVNGEKPALSGADKPEKIALVVEGGAMRGIFATGVMDAFMEADYNPFNLFIGVSAGSTALASYVAGQHQRNYKIFTTYSLGEEFISFKKFLRGGHLVDLDWLWEVTIRDMRLDLKKICADSHDFFVGVTNAHTGRAEFIQPTEDWVEETTKASSALPIMYRNQIKLHDQVYVDGGLAAPIPVEEAVRQGATKIMVIRSRPKSYVMKSKPMNYLVSKAFLKEYPALLEAVKNRPLAYAKSIAFLRSPNQRVKMLEVNPPETFGTKRLTKDLDQLNQDYELGRAMGLEVMRQFDALLEK